MTQEKKKVNISTDLFEMLEKKVCENKFKSVESYIEHILRQVLQVSNPEELDPEEEEEIKKRLEKLGYL